MTRKRFSITLLVALLGSTANAQESVENSLPKSAAIDTVAMSAKLLSIKSFETIAREKKGTPQEVAILFRLVEILHSTAAIEFRLAHSKAKNKEGDLTQYQNLQKKSISHLLKIINGYPNHPNLSRAIYLLGNSRQETGDKKGALAEYRRLADNFPKANETSLAIISLGDLLTELKDYDTAISYLKRVEAQPEEKPFPLALGRLAWIYYYKGDLAKALHYSKILIENKIDIDKTLSNAALFYATGLESHLPEYTAEKALKFFKYLAPDNSILKAAIHLALILRTKGLDTDLEVLKTKALDGPELTEAESADLLRIVLEDYLNKRRYTELISGLRELITRTQKSETENSKALAFLSKITNKLQEEYLANKESIEGIEKGNWLIQLYQIVIQSYKSRPDILENAHFSLAEILYLKKNYKEATLHYRWVATHTNQEKGPLSESAVRAVASRHEELRGRPFFPKNLVAQSISKTALQKVSDDTQEWFEWVDQLEDKKEWELFRFESDRLLYALGHIEKATKRIHEFVKKRPKSAYALPAASLFIDTLIASEDWAKTHEISKEFLQVEDWTNNAFHMRLQEVAENSFLKLIELNYQSQSYAAALEQIHDFLIQYPKSRHQVAARTITANIYLAQGNRLEAHKEFQAISKLGPLNSNIQGIALLTAASVAENNYDFDLAIENYQNYFRQSPAVLKNGPPVEELRQKMRFLLWLSGDHTKSAVTLNCPKALENQQEGPEDPCKYTELLWLLTSNQKIDSDKLNRSYKAFRNSSGKTRLLWAVVALENQDTRILKHFLKSWKEFDSLERLAMLPRLNQSLVKTFQQLRKEVKFSARIRLDPNIIANRTKALQQAEAVLTSYASDFEWQRLQAASLNEAANLYRDLSNEIGAIPKPSGLDKEGSALFEKTLLEIRAPFDEKRNEYRKKAFELGSNQSIDSEVFSAIIESYFSESSKTKPSERIPGSLKLNKPITIKIQNEPNTPDTKQLMVQIEKSLVENRYQATAFLIQELEKKNIVKKQTLTIIKANLLFQVGEQAEGVSLLEEALPYLERNEGQLVFNALIDVRRNTLAQEAAQKLMQNYPQFGEN